MAFVDEFLRESNRLKSFMIFEWPLKRNMHTKALAKAGFYYYGDGDRVQCAFCNGILGDWEEDDLPMYQHRKFFPNCPFLNNPYGCGNVALIERSSSLKQVTLPFPVESEQLEGMSLPRKTKKKGKRLTFCLPGEDGQPVESCRKSRFAYRPCHPDMASYEKRLGTFRKHSKWPLVTMTSLPTEHLAEAGFFYSGPSDVVCCFFCNGTLSRWLPNDDAWVEHAKWYPRCLHLQLVKGPDFINELTRQWSRPVSSTFSNLSASDFNNDTSTVSKVEHLYNYEGGRVSRVSHL